MNIKSVLSYVIALFMILSLVGCGSSPSKDDSDVKKKMVDLEDGVYYTLSRVKEISEDEEHINTTFERNKFLTHEKDFTLISGELKRDCYAVMEWTKTDEAIVTEKSAPYTFFVAFDDGTISIAGVDQNLLDPAVTEANLISEDVLCVKELKKGLNWYSTNGNYSEVERFEYVVIDAESRSADSFQIITYKDDTKSEIVRRVWWTPEIGWCCQWQEYLDGTLNDYYILTDLNYDWDDED